MATLVSDNFTRANNPTSLGTAPTGQVWNQVLGTAGSFGINSDNALWTWHDATDDPAVRTVVETGFTDAVTSVALVNPNDTAASFGIMVGIVFRYVDPNYLWQLNYPWLGSTGLTALKLVRVYAGTPLLVLDIPVVLSDGDVIGAAYCRSNIEVFINGISQGTYDDSANPQNYGTKCGLQGAKGTYFSTILRRFDNFLVETNDACPSWTLPPLQWTAGGTVVGVTPPPGPAPSIETCSTSKPEENSLQRVQRVLDFTQGIHRNLQLQISANAPLTLYGYSMEWTPVSVSELTNQRNAYTGSVVFPMYGSFFLAYIAHISTEDITWNITVDNDTLDSYVIPNGAGVYQKTWVIVKAKKGKIWDWSFSSDAEFQIIPSQSIVKAKSWESSAAYEDRQLFGDMT